MKNDCNVLHPLNRQGTSQNERLPEAFDKEYVKIDERGFLDLIRQSAEYSKYLAYYQVGDPDTINTDWRDFFNEIYDFSSGSCKIKSIDELKIKSELSPHLALFIAFLQLFGIAQENLNELPKRHLKLFYEEILQLKHKNAKPDRLAVFAEINKGYESIQLKENMNLIAGKDVSGKELIYRTVDETIINKAVIADLKTLFVERNEQGKVLNFSAALKANTSDGIKEPITTSPPSWNTFGDTGKIQARIGFAIWSPVLNMPEGDRTITISASDGFNSDINGKLKIEYTSVKNWESVSEFSVINSKLVIKIKVEKPAFIPFSKEIHNDVFIVSNPVLKITLMENDHIVYNLLQQISLLGLHIKAEVNGYKSLILQNDNGGIDPSKPFLPFGSRTVMSSSKFIIGNQYAFNKHLSGFTLKPVSKYYGYNFNRSNIQVLTNADWINLTGPTEQFKNIFQNNYSTDKDDLSYTCQTKNNFIRIINLDSDSNSEQHVYTQKFANFINKVAGSIQPKIPYAPELESLTMDYITEVDVNEVGSESGVFHIFPFGYDSNISNRSNIVPEFSTEGNLVIGISDFKKGQSVSIHFLMKESSGDPDKKTRGIKWYYYINNRPVEFKQHEIIKNTTNSFTTSGIITFAIPADAFSLCTVLPSEYVWLSASCSTESLAYPELINIRAQAFECEFSDNGNDVNHLSKPLSPQSITKFQVPVEGIKKVEQPYSSYGGRMFENDISFNIRVSELLRHKNRSINIWDYERMILEEFPDIYRVKCISHSRQNSEYSPGGVLVVVIPQLYNIDTQEILEPKVSVGNREKILKFICKYTSPFVKIEVINPVYEEIEVKCHVSFMQNIADKEFYSNKLNEDLKDFLAPWKSGIKRDLNFHGKLYKSQIIDFIDEREYVDYITFIEVKKHSQTGIKIYDDMISASNESVVLTSINQHIIDPYTQC